MIGRPTKYTPEYCGRAIEVLSEGKSVLSLAADLNVSEQTVYNWMKEHEAFFEAVKIGQAKAAAYWEDLALRNAISGEGNATLTIFGLKNRSRTQWADISRTEVTGKDGEAVKIDSRDIGELTDEQLAAIAAGGVK